MASGFHCVPALAIWAVAFVCCPSSAYSANPPADGRTLYEPCVVCHQPTAWGSPDGNIPSLAGQQASYIERQLAMFRSGTRSSTAMQVMSAHPAFDSQPSIVELSDYLASLNPNPRPVTGSGTHRHLGREIYSRLCASCHGTKGRGDAQQGVPAVMGQHYPYLRHQIEQVATLHREFVPAHMSVVLGNLYGDQKDAVADYMSRLNESAAEPQLNP